MVNESRLGQTHAEGYIWLLFGILVSFQDTILAASPLSFLGASPAFLCVASLIFLNALRFCNRLTLRRFSLVFIFLFVNINLISLTINFGEYSHGRSLNVKGLNYIALYVLFMFPFFIGYSVSKEYLKYSIKIAFFFSLLGWLGRDLLSIERFGGSFLSYSNKVFDRSSGFSFEPSMFSASLLSLFFSLVILRDRVVEKYNYVFVTVIPIVFAGLIGSKGGMLAVGFASLAPAIFSRRLFSVRGFIVVLLLLLSVFPLFYLLVVTFVLNIEDSLSFATRLSVIFLSLICLQDNPFGVGFFGFLPAFSEYMDISLSVVQSLFPFDLRLGEVKQYGLAETDAGVGTKSFFFNMVIIFGWPFVLFFFVLLYRGVKYSRAVGRNDLEVACWFLALSLIMFVEGLGIYSLGILGYLIIYELIRSRSHSVSFLEFKNKVFKV